MNANGYRAIFESVGSKIEETVGVLLWKLNAAFPSMIWQLYDWYLNPNAGYYFTKRAVELIHVQMNLSDYAVTVVNRQFQQQENLTVWMRLYDADMDKFYDETLRTNVPAQKALEVSKLASQLESHNALAFVELALLNSNGERVSYNVYWLEPRDNYRELEELHSANLEVIEIKPPVEKEGDWQIRLENRSDRLAFFIHAKIARKSGEEILPAYWSDNYISMAPGDSVWLEVSLRDAPHMEKLLHLSVNGWNLESKVVPLEWDE